MRSKSLNFIMLTLVVLSSLSACKAEKPVDPISLDGSSTVYPLSKAIMEAFGKMNPSVQFKLEASGTGGGFKKFCAGGIDITGASRPINSTEIEQCKAQQIEYIELPVAFDSLTLVVNAKNTFAHCLSVNELRTMWEPAAEGKVTTWQKIRPSFPAQPLVLFSPGKDSGTFDYFTLAIVGAEGKSRGDVTMSEDDMVTERGVASNPNAIGYFGYAYYQANRDTVKAVAIDKGNGCVAPRLQTVVDATYQPLSRPLFIYVNAASAARPDIQAFTRFYLSSNSAPYVTKVGYVPLPSVALSREIARFNKGAKGSAFEGRGSVVGVNLDWFNIDEEEKIKAQLVQ